jgi:hypothetical protein
MSKTDQKPSTPKVHRRKSQLQDVLKRLAQLIARAVAVDVSTSTKTDPNPSEEKSSETGRDAAPSREDGR